MDKTPGCVRRHARHFLAGAVLCCATISVPAVAADEAIVRSESGIAYVSGGVGAGSLERLGAITGQFNLKLVFALKSGNYLSGVGVSIFDHAGQALLAVTTEGPWLLVNLPAGRYRIVATLADTPVRRNVVIGTTPLQTVDFRWAAE
jgi:hypothetical protein